MSTLQEFFQVRSPRDIRKMLLKSLRWAVDGDLTSFMTPAQKLIHDTVILGDKFEYYILCSRRFGKTYVGVCMAIGFCLKHPGAVVYIVGPEIQQTLKMIRRQLATLFNKYDMPKDLFKDLPDKLGPGWIFPNGSEVYITGFSAKSNPQNARGDYADLIIVEEPRDFNPNYYNDSIKGIYLPMLTDTDGKIIFSTTPPEDPNHPFVEDLLKAKKANNGTYHSYTLDDNDRYSKAKKERIVESFGGRESIYVRREFYCEIVRNPERMVIPYFDRSRHVQDYKLNTGAFYLVGGDLGGIQDMSAIFTMAVDQKTGACVFVGESISKSGTKSGKIIEGARHMEKLWSLEEPQRYLDMPEQTRMDHEADHNYMSLPPEKTDLTSAIAAFNDALSDGQVIISSSCPFLAKSLESVRFNKSGKDIERTKEYGHGDAVIGAVYCYRMRHKARSLDNQSVSVSHDYPAVNPWNRGYLGVSWGRLNKPTVLVALTENLELIHFSVHQMNPGPEVLEVIQGLFIRHNMKHMTVCHSPELLSRGFKDTLAKYLDGFKVNFRTMTCPTDKDTRHIDGLFDLLDTDRLNLDVNHTLKREAMKVLHDPDAYKIRPETEALLQATSAITAGDEVKSMIAMITNAQEERQYDR